MAPTVRSFSAECELLGLIARFPECYPAFLQGGAANEQATRILGTYPLPAAALGVRPIRLRPVERRVCLSDLARAQEVFMSNAVNRPMPVAGIHPDSGAIRLRSFDLALRLRARLDVT